MDTDALRWFQQVADGVTVTEVSELETITQSGVSRALARLDAEVGAPLLRRSGRTLRMTHAGRVFKRHVDALLHQLDDGLAAVDQLIDPETGAVALAFQLSLGTWLVPDLVSSFRLEHPRVQFTLRQVNDEVVSSALTRQEVDLEITTLRPRNADVRWHRLAVEPLRLAVSAGHRLAGRQTIDLNAVAEEPFITGKSATLLRELTDDLCNRAGFSPAVAFECDDLPTVLGFVAAGMGVGIVPALRRSTRAPAAGTSRPGIMTDGLAYLALSDPGASREIGLAWSAERRLLPAAELFRAHVVSRARDGLLPPLDPPAESGTR